MARQKKVSEMTPEEINRALLQLEEDYGNKKKINKNEYENYINEREKEAIKAGQNSMRDNYIPPDNKVNNKENKPESSNFTALQADRTNPDEIDYRYKYLESVDPNIYKIIGLPPQFIADTDNRIYSSNPDSIGRIYNSQIIRNMTTVTFRIGRPEFLGQSSWFGQAAEREKILEGIVKNSENEDDADRLVKTSGIITNLMSSEKGFRYYDFKDNYDEYVNMVNLLLAPIVFELRKIDNRLTGEHAIFENIYKPDTGPFNVTYFGRRHLTFYVDGSTSYSESFSNNTTESMLASTLKGFTKMSKDVRFLFGKSDSWVGKLGEIAGNAIESLTGFAGGDSSGDSAISKAAETIFSGGNILFPEIWDDSTMSKSYSLVIKLSSHDGSPAGIYFNIIVPMIAILCMALPSQNSFLGYEAPFIIKCHSKGYFNCDLGMISNIDIRKGGNNSWSVDGLPTEVEISIGIKDLYPTLTLAPSKISLTDLATNVGLIEYIATLSGIDLMEAQPFNWWESLKFYTDLTLSRFKRAATTGAVETISDYYNKFIGTIFGYK